MNRNNNFFYVRQSAVVSKDDIPSDYWREELFCSNAALKFNRKYLVCSSFDHYAKKHRGFFRPIIKPTHEVVFIDTPGYASNKSIFRIIDAFFFSIKLFVFFKKNGREGDKAVFSMPTPEALLVLPYLRSLGIITIIDFRDAWPEALVSNKFLKLFFSLYIKFIFFISGVKKSKFLSMSDGMSRYYSGFLSVPINKFKTVVFKKHRAYSGLSSCNYIPPTKFVFFVGTISESFDYDAFLNLRNQINIIDRSIYMLIAGDGPLLNYLKSIFVGHDNVVFLGSIPNNSARHLMDISLFNFCFYRGNAFNGHLTNKVLEYIDSKSPFMHNLGDISFNGVKYCLGFDLSEVSVKEILSGSLEDDSDEFLEAISNFNLD